MHVQKLNHADLVKKSEIGSWVWNFLQKMISRDFPTAARELEVSTGSEELSSRRSDW